MISNWKTKHRTFENANLFIHVAVSRNSYNCIDDRTPQQLALMWVQRRFVFFLDILLTENVPEEIGNEHHRGFC